MSRQAEHGQFAQSWCGSQTVGGAPGENCLNNVGAGEMGVQSLPISKAKGNSYSVHFFCKSLRRVVMMGATFSILKVEATAHWPILLSNLILIYAQGD